MFQNYASWDKSPSSFLCLQTCPHIPAGALWSGKGDGLGNRDLRTRSQLGPVSLPSRVIRLSHLPQDGSSLGGASGTPWSPGHPRGDFRPGLAWCPCSPPNSPSRGGWQWLGRAPSGVGVPSHRRLGPPRNATRLSWILNPEPVTGGKGPRRSPERRVRHGADGDPGERAPGGQWGGPGSPLTGSRRPAVGRLHSRRARLPAAPRASDGRGRTPPVRGEPRPRGAGRRPPGGGTTSAPPAGGEGPSWPPGGRAWRAGPGLAPLISARSSGPSGGPPGCRRRLGGFICMSLAYRFSCAGKGSRRGEEKACD